MHLQYSVMLPEKEMGGEKPSVDHLFQPSTRQLWALTFIFKNHPHCWTSQWMSHFSTTSQKCLHQIFKRTGPSAIFLFSWIQECYFEIVMWNFNLLSLSCSLLTVLLLVLPSVDPTSPLTALWPCVLCVCFKFSKYIFCALLAHTFAPA